MPRRIEHNSVDPVRSTEATTSNFVVSTSQILEERVIADTVLPQQSAAVINYFPPNTNSTETAMTAQLTLADWTKRASQKVSRTQLFIDGKFVDAASGKTFESINPRDGSIIAHVAEGDVEDVNRAVAVAKRTFDAGVWSEMAPLDRKNVMLKWAQLIRDHAEE